MTGRNAQCLRLPATASWYTPIPSALLYSVPATCQDYSTWNAPPQLSNKIFLYGSLYTVISISRKGATNPQKPMENTQINPIIAM